jgi:hypothetical protein
VILPIFSVQCTPSSPVRERERENGRLRDREREKEKEGERERDRERERQRQRCRKCPEWLFLFLKGMTGALAPYSYILLYTYLSSLDSANINMIGRICSRVI